jgi:hypothetical protein
MRDVEDIREMIEHYKSIYMEDPCMFVDDYEWGLCNGLEIALALVEGRPTFYIDKYKRYDKYDVDNNPEYFL